MPCHVNYRSTFEYEFIFYFAALQNFGSLAWPDSYVVVVASLEQASHDSLYSDFQKYNQKMRQLVFNLKVRLAFGLAEGQNYNVWFFMSSGGITS